MNLIYEKIYNDLGQLIEDRRIKHSMTINYEYDMNGNISVESISSKSLPFIHSILKVTYEYDENNNIVKCITKESGKTKYEKYYKYDENNRIIEVSEKYFRPKKCSDIRTTYKYDGLTVTKRIFGVDYLRVIRKKYKDKINGIILQEHRHYESFRCNQLSESKIIFIYDIDGRLIQKDKNYANKNKILTTNYEYYKDTDILLKEVSSNGDIVEYIYDNLDI